LSTLLGKDIKWNFAKYLVSGVDGKVVKFYEPPQNPLSFEGDILELLEVDDMPPATSVAK
jgi:glutathione peroxidase-family protein